MAIKLATQKFSLHAKGPYNKELLHSPCTNRFYHQVKLCICILNLLYLYPGFYSYAEGVTWKILDHLKETLLIEFNNPQSRFPGHSAESTEEGCIGKFKCPFHIAHFSRVGISGNRTCVLLLLI